MKKNKSEIEKEKALNLLTDLKNYYESFGISVRLSFKCNRCLQITENFEHPWWCSETSNPYGKYSKEEH